MSDKKQKVFEFRGIDNLYIAKILKDDNETDGGYECEKPIYLSPVAEITKSTDTSSEEKYYDNKALLVINGEGADTIGITLAPPELKLLAKITGKSFDEETGMLVDGERDDEYYALMYRTKGTDGEYRYVVRSKGTFSIPDETNATENNGTDSNNTSIEYKGIYTTHEFNKGKYNGTSWEKGAVKGIVIDTRYGKADLSKFFDSVQTPDTIKKVSE